MFLNPIGEIKRLTILKESIYRKICVLAKIYKTALLDTKMSNKDTITIDIGKIKNSFKNLSINIWLVTTIVLAIVLIVVLFSNSGVSKGNEISAEEAGQKMVDFANSQGATSSLIETSDNGALYEIVISIDGEQVPIYVTKDGESFTTTLIPFDIGSGAVNSPDNTGNNIQISVDQSDPLLGNKEAQFIVFEYSDFECPFCGRAYSDAIANLKSSEEFQNGEVSLVYRHFPLNSIHPNAQKAAEASECANRQGKFWEYHDILFENQQALDIDSLKSHASSLGLDQTKFDSCLDNAEAKEKVDEDLISATSNGGTGTPYFIILNTENGKTATVSGAVPYDQIESAIEAVRA